ncbi:MAG: sugar ABC transporter ATP-binding protein [Geminicoccaceae bacterium]
MERAPPRPDDAAPPVLAFRGLVKRFGGTLAVDDVSFELRRGEILALLGQNGAGKSTVIKMLAGVYPADGGEFRFAGEAYAPSSHDRRIAFIHQDLGLIDWMTVAENIAMAQGFPRRRGLIDWAAVEARAKASLARVGAGIQPGQRVLELSRTEKSLVAIARALETQADVLVLDEPTASLPKHEVETLFKVLRALKAAGTSMIYVSHRLDEVFAVCDRLVVLRDGRLVGDQATAGTEPAELVRMIIGRPPEALFVRPPRREGTVSLRLDGLVVGEVGPVELEAAEGEILGLVGLRGAGQEEVGRALFGIERPDAGSIAIGGRRVAAASPIEAMRDGLGFVAGDRTAESVLAGMSVRENMFVNPFASGRRLFGWRRPADEAEEVRRLGETVHLKPNDPAAPIETLSGGNQQKVVMARWMRIGGRVLVLEDPTAGVDVGAKAEVYRLLAQATREGLAVVLVSTDFEEVAQICHRVLVFRQGRIVAEVPEAELSVERLVHAASLPTEPRAA